MTPDQVQAWLNRTPAAAASAEHRSAALALGQAFEGLRVRVAALPAQPAPQPVMVVEEAQVHEAFIDLDRPNRRGPYARRTSRRASQPQQTETYAPVRARAA